MSKLEYELRPFWNRYFKFNWKFGILLLLIVCIPRFILVLNANETGNYSLIGLVMFLSALVPFIFLSKYGRKKTGIKTTKKLRFIISALIIGLVLSIVLYFLGQALYGISYENWYKYIGKSYNIPENISVQDRKTLFILMAITGMIFSPIGEEFFLEELFTEVLQNPLEIKKHLL